VIIIIIINNTRTFFLYIRWMNIKPTTQNVRGTIKHIFYDQNIRPRIKRIIYIYMDELKKIALIKPEQ